MMLMKRLDMNDINAYLDGALSEAERREVEAALDSDPVARALLNRFRRQVDELHRLYDPVLEEPVPSAMLQIVQDHGRPPGGG